MPPTSAAGSHGGTYCPALVLRLDNPLRVRVCPRAALAAVLSSPAALQRQQRSKACLEKQREALAKRQAERSSPTELSKRPRADAAEAPETLEETPWLFQYALQVEFKEHDGLAAIETTLRWLLTPQTWSDFVNAARADESLKAWQLLHLVRPGIRMLPSEAERQKAAERGQKAERPKAAAIAEQGK